jgi:hypothetical protein
MAGCAWCMAVGRDNQVGDGVAMTDKEYEAMLFCAVSRLIADMPEMVRRSIVTSGYSPPHDNQVNDAIDRAIASRFMDFKRAIIFHEISGNA